MPPASRSAQFRILLFGPMAQAAEADSLMLECVGGGAIVADLRRGIAASHPALAGLLGSHRFAINSQFAREDQAVTADDEIALIGMVSGG